MVAARARRGPRRRRVSGVAGIRRLGGQPLAGGGPSTLRRSSSLLRRRNSPAPALDPATSVMIRIRIGVLTKSQSVWLIGLPTAVTAMSWDSVVGSSWGVVAPVVVYRTSGVMSKFRSCTPDRVGVTSHTTFWFGSAWSCGPTKSTVLDGSGTSNPAPTSRRTTAQDAVTCTIVVGSFPEMIWRDTFPNPTTASTSVGTPRTILLRGWKVTSATSALSRTVPLFVLQSDWSCASVVGLNGSANVCPGSSALTVPPVAGPPSAAAVGGIAAELAATGGGGEGAVVGGDPHGVVVVVAPMPPGAIGVVVDVSVNPPDVVDVVEVVGVEEVVVEDVDVVVDEDVVVVDGPVDSRVVGVVPLEHGCVLDVLVPWANAEAPGGTPLPVGAGDPWAMAMNPNVPTNSTAAASTPMIQPNGLLSATP